MHSRKPFALIFAALLGPVALAQQTIVPASPAHLTISAFSSGMRFVIFQAKKLPPFTQLKRSASLVVMDGHETVDQCWSGVCCPNRTTTY